MSEKDTTYNGWTNYETWAVKLWIDNEQLTHEYWRENTRHVWAATALASVDPLQPETMEQRLIDARTELVECLKQEYTQGDVFDLQGLANTVYADLLSAALGEVNWYEIADAMLEDEQDSDTISGYRPRTARK